MRGLIFGSAILGGALLAALAFGETTEVTVEKGAVKAETENGTVTLVPGQKGILKEGGAPQVTVDDVLVADVLRMKKWLDGEKQQSRLGPHDAATIQSMEFDAARVKAAAYADLPEDAFNAREYSKETGTLELGQIGGDATIAVYDMDGRKISSDAGKDGRVYAHVGVLDPTKRMQLIMVAESLTPEYCMQKDGNLRRCVCGSGADHSVSYNRMILPKSAILVSAWPDPICINDSDGRTAVTFRQRKLATGDIPVIEYLWPEKDGVTMESLPPEYRGLRDPRDVQLSESYQRQMAAILAGADYRDQSTPVAALLTWRCAVVKEDKELLREAYYASQKKGQKRGWNVNFQDEPDWGVKTRSYFIENMTFLSTPEWPDQPKEGCIHPVHMCYPGTLLRCDTQAVIFHDGKCASSATRAIGATPT